jgi:hypothetical protein
MNLIILIIAKLTKRRNAIEKVTQLGDFILAKKR